MPYFNYHATAKALIAGGKLVNFYFAERHGDISPALVLVFDDEKHPVMPIRENKWEEYLPLSEARGELAAFGILKSLTFLSGLFPTQKSENGAPILR